MKEQQKIVYSYYVLDIIHTGHILMLKNSKALAGKNGILIVGILTDEAVMERKPKPVLSFEQRIQIAESIKYVDIAVPQATYSPLPNVGAIRPDILMESASHRKEDIEQARKTVAAWGGKVITMPYYPETSSTQIKNAIKENQRGDSR
jgi:cytidyltransferase-like protein